MAKDNLSLLLLGLLLLPPLVSSALPSTSAHSERDRSFIIDNDTFWKDGVPFRIIGGDLHYFRVLPQIWKDRLLRAKALGLNTIQTYVPWNLHEVEPGQYNFKGSADLPAFLQLAHELGLLVMLRVGPYICGESSKLNNVWNLCSLSLAEWDLGGFPAWLLALRPSLRLRSSDPQYLNMVDKWWGALLPTLADSLYTVGGPVIMVQIENEYGSYGSDKVYLQHLLTQVRAHLGDKLIIYTTDGAETQNLNDGTLHGYGVYAAIDFPTGSDAASAFELQRHYNAPGKSPPLSAEFYTGYLTHWGEPLAKTDAVSTADSLDRLLRLNASVVLYMAHGGTNFGFYSGANTGSLSSDFQPDITSYDYDAPIGEAGDVGNSKFKAIREVLRRYSVGALPDPPALPERKAYGAVPMSKIASLFDMLASVSQPKQGVRTDWPSPMEMLNQAFGFILYQSILPRNVHPGSRLSVVQVHDRAQVFVGGTDAKRIYLGKLERWSGNSLVLSDSAAVPGLQLHILVENMGRVNYGPYMSDQKGITEAVLLDNVPILGWTAYPIPLENVSELMSDFVRDKTTSHFRSNATVETAILESKAAITTPIPDLVSGPAFYQGTLTIEIPSEPADTFLSLRGWTKGVAFVNGFNVGRFWPSVGPQCTLYVPAPLLHSGNNEVIILELENSSYNQTVQFLDDTDFSCGTASSVSFGWR